MQANRRCVLLSSGVLLGTLAGCLGDDGSADDSDANLDIADAPFDSIGIDTFELLDRSHDHPEKIAYMHGDHWHGHLPSFSPSEALSIGANVVGEDGEPVEIGDEYEFAVDYSPGADESVVTLDHHGDHVHIVGEEEGVSELVFLLVHDNHIEYQSDGITVTVGEESSDHHHDDHHHDDH